jgi:hypothetical protein
MKFKWLLLPLLALFFVACDDEVSYSDMKERETRAVKEFIRSEGINVISFNDFIKNDSTTDVENNEYVIIDDVYMQIVRNPKGVEGARQLSEGNNDVMARFIEYNISEADTILGNVFDSDNPDYMRVKLDHGSYSATFTNGYMAITYGSAVPTGWLTPLPYIYFTRRQSQTAKVRLIVPHTKGTSTASSYVYPCFYEITFIPENLYDTD